MGLLFRLFKKKIPPHLYTWMSAVSTLNLDIFGFIGMSCTVYTITGNIDLHFSGVGTIGGFYWDIILKAALPFMVIGESCRVVPNQR
jgi:hypothetical protein